MKTIKFQVNSLIILIILFIMLIGNIKAADSLKYIGHSFVKIKTSEGMVIYIDPALTNSFEDSADVVLISHEHSDHNEISRVKRKVNCTTIRAANALKSGVYQTFNIGKIMIKAVPATNSYHPKNSSVGFVISIPVSDGDTIKLYHPGDTGKITEMADLANQNITYAFLPMDGTYTMTPEVAAQAAALINAKYDIPIHTMPGTPGYSDAIVARFTSPNKMVLKPGNTIALSNTTTSIQEGKIIKADSHGLSQNYPNPFNPETIISYQLSEPGLVDLSIYDLLGRKVASLINKYQTTGSYQTVFNAGNIPSGVYIYKLETNTFTLSKKMILAK